MIVTILAPEESWAAEGGRAEPLEHAVAAFESRGDAEGHHRGRHDGEGEDAGHEEVHRVGRRRRDDRDLGEEDEEHDGDADGEEERLAAAKGHVDLGAGLGDEGRRAGVGRLDAHRRGAGRAHRRDLRSSSAGVGRGRGCRFGRVVVARGGVGSDGLEVHVLEGAADDEIGQRDTSLGQVRGDGCGDGGPGLCPAVSTR